MFQMCGARSFIKHSHKYAFSLDWMKVGRCHQLCSLPHVHNELLLCTIDARKIPLPAAENVYQMLCSWERLALCSSC